MAPSWTVRLGVTLALSATVALSGCKPKSCLSGEDGCVVDSPCGALPFTCSGGAATVKVVGPTDVVRHGQDALAATGDVLLENDQVSAVIDGIDHRHYLNETGGTLIDLSTKGHDDDGLNQVLQAIGILPGDQVVYSKMEIVSKGPDVAAVQFRGSLFGHPDVKVATRYELRPCEPGIRVRTELVNESPDPVYGALLDGFYWSLRELYPFTPAIGGGFTHPPFDLVSINGAFAPAPFMAASNHDVTSASYSEVACDEDELVGFNSSQITGEGLPRSTIYPRDVRVFERFIAASPKEDIAGAADLAMQVRGKLFGEKYVRLSGHTLVSTGAGVGGDERLASVMVSVETATPPTDANLEPWNQALPDRDGAFSMLVPAGKPLHVRIDSFGRTVFDKSVAASTKDFDVGDIVVAEAAELTLKATDADDPTTEIPAQAFFVAADQDTKARTSGNLYGLSDECTPYLGFPSGGSPACNRALVDGHTTLFVPDGSYDVYLTRGPFWTVEKEHVELAGGEAKTLEFSLRKLAIAPPGTLGADLHVHGAASFDSSIPDSDRVLAFAAADVDVLAATDHDNVYDYADAMKARGLERHIQVIPGVETTGHALFLKVPGSTIPKVIGHWNFFPMTMDPTLPHNGAPDDEFAEPGELFDRIDADPTFTAMLGIRQLNHPWAASEFGRDLGFPRALGMKLNEPLPTSDDGTANGMFVRTPKDPFTGVNAKSPNDAYQTQEVMNGTRNQTYLQYRAFWFYLNNLGLLRTGTANSDSHGLSDSLIGSPRNVVTVDTAPGPDFDQKAFDQALRDGHSMGTNGPVIDLSVDGADGQPHVPGLAPVQPTPASKLLVRVRAAPWVPVDEVRVVVDGKVAKTFTTEIRAPADPLEAMPTGDELVRFEAEIPLDTLLAPGTDGWVVVEAGAPLEKVADLDGDGMPDTSDNNKDGVIDAKDVGKGLKSGPILDPPPPDDGQSAGYVFGVVVPGARPESFTNPLVIDWNGDGWKAPGLGGGK